MKNLKAKGLAKISLKIFIAVMILTMSVPVFAFGTVESLLNDTTEPGRSLAQIYPKQEVDIQFSLAEDNAQEITIPTTLTEDQLAVALEEGKITLSLDRNAERGYLDPTMYPFASAGGSIIEAPWMTQKNTNIFEVKLEANGSDIKATIKSNCYFYNRNKTAVDYSVPHTQGGAFFDICGYFDLNVKNGDAIIAKKDAKVVPYDSYRTIYELYDEIDSIASYDTDLYVKKESMGSTSVDGYDMPYIIIADKKASVDAWLAYTDEVEKNPEKALKDIEAGVYDNLRIPAFYSNVHANENGATNGILNFAWMLLKNESISYKTINGLTDAGVTQLALEQENEGVKVSELIDDYASCIGAIRGGDGSNWLSKPLEMNKYYNMEDKEIAVEDLLDDMFIVLIPTMNEEGYAHNTRVSSKGYDPNRDEANQTLAEDANTEHLVNTFNPMVFTEVHGRVENMLIEPCTPPHEPNYEYDLVAKQFVELGEAAGIGAIANSEDYNCYEMPFRDYLKTKSESPSGVEWTEPWDDMTTAYGSQYPVLIGCVGITWELPSYDDRTAEVTVPYGLLNQSVYLTENKTELLTSQAMLFKRGVNNENSNEEVAPWYVNQYDQEGKDAQIMRPVFDGEGENGNFYPECYIIPLDNKNQTNLQAAAEDIKYLTRNDVKVNIADKAFTYGGVTYPKGTAVVSCYQAKRSILNSQLSDGTFITNWKGLYSESFAQRSHARGYDRIIVAKKADYDNIITACQPLGGYEDALKYLADFDSQFTGIKNRDVIIENASEDSAAAVNMLLKDGLQVGMITEGDDKGDFVCAYTDYLKIAEKFILTATGVNAKNIKAVKLEKAPKAYVPGAPNTSTAGYINSASAYNYTFDKLAVERMGFDITQNVDEADFIINSQSGRLTDTVLEKIKAGVPYIGHGYQGFNAVSALIPDAQFSGQDYGTDALAYVEYPENTLLNATYIKEADNILYEYGATYFSKIPTDAVVVARNVAKKPLQGCIGIFDDDTKAQFDQYQTGIQAFEYKNDNLNLAMFACSLTYKAHQRDESGYIANFAFSESLGEKAYTPVPVSDGGGIYIPPAPQNPEPDSDTPEESKPTDSEKIDAQKAAVKAVKIVARTRKLKTEGKTIIKVYWQNADGSKPDMDGYQVFRSLKKYSGFGNKAYFTTSRTKYYNSKVKAGTTYYYKVRGYKLIDGKRVYTPWSTKGIRTA